MTISTRELKSTKVDLLREKAKKGFQMVRLPRCGTTLALTTMEQLLPKEKFAVLGCGAFSDMPFSWGPYHNEMLQWPPEISPNSFHFNDVMRIMRENLGFGFELEYPDLMKDGNAGILFNPNLELDNTSKVKIIQKDWIDDFNIRLDQRPDYDPNKLTFQIVRNPYDWLTSIYSWNFLGIDGTPPEVAYGLDLLKYDDWPMTAEEKKYYSERILAASRPFEKEYNTFDEFIDYIFQLPPNATWEEKCNFPFPYPMMDKCFFQPFDNNGDCKVDLFIRFEYLGHGLQSMLDLGDHGLSVGDLALPHSLQKKRTNWSKNNKFNDYKHKFYTNFKSIEKVQDAYNWDLETFNYDFNGPRDDRSCFPLGE